MITTEMPSNEELIAMAEAFDGFALDFCETNRMSPLAMSGVFLARMTKMANEFGYPDEYTRLLTEIVNMHVLSQATASGDSTAIH